MIKEILKSLVADEGLGRYRFSHLIRGFDLRYKIESRPWYKTLPFETIDAAYKAYLKGDIIDRKWYNKFCKKESDSRPCNLGVLKALLGRLDKKNN
ncbi:hypothetical protein GVN16_25390 [Emticicia sp. CRIBPO]|uniref:hypothetical protein n=1 Tax=Emticicia sp. CRIBPO TaxID=2683258 RepID=UPI0014129D10|nr:hypothetical protein [Emticicia sp. CRIBPO]NBA89137.1 hypothetical protein [Emticicia sp. CRIBPO]